MSEIFSILIENRSRPETEQSGGAWLTLPTTTEQLHAAMENVGISAEKTQDFVVGGFANTEGCPFEVPLSVIQNSSIDELNYLGKLLETQTDDEREKFAAAVTHGEYAGSVKDLINLAQNLDCYGLHPDIQNEEDYGYYLIDKLGELELPEGAKKYFMYEEYGRDAAIDEGGTFTEHGYIYKNNKPFEELYNGREVPEEHRIMNYPQLPVQQTIPVKPIVLTSENSADNLKEITDRLEQGITDLFNSERYKEYLSVMSKFHNYSFNNTLLIAMQKPDASLVAGFSAWKNNFERNVMKGEKGIKIIAPAPFKIKKEVEKIDPQTQQPVIGKDGKPVKETQEVTIPAYKVVSVFDVSQTEGKELPDIAIDTLTGDVEQYKDFFASLEKTSPVPIAFEKIEGSANGYYHLEEKRIAIDEGMSELQTLKTAIHEIAHAKLHDIDLNAPKEERQNVPDRRTREVQAESIAYTVCQHFGLDTSDYSFGYVAGWSSGRDLAELKSSLETIRTAANEIITSIDAHFAEIQKAKEKEQSAELDKDTFTIYQIKGGDEMQDYRFEPYDRLKSAGLTVDPENYEAVYTSPLTPDMSLEDIYTRFNVDHPKDFAGHSLSVSDVVVLHQNGQDTAHYVDSFGYQQVPEFFQEQGKELIPHDLTTGEKITTPRGTFHVTDMTREQMEAAGYGFHHQSNDGKYLIMGNGTQAFAVAVEQAPSMVDDLETKVKAGEQISLVDLAETIKAEKQQGKGKKEKPSIRAQLKADKEKSAPKKATAKTKNNDLEV